MPGRSISTERGARHALALVGLLCGLGLGCGDSGPGGPGGAAAPQVVVDEAGILGPEEARRLDEQHAVLLRDHDIDYRIEVTAAAGDLATFAARRFREREVGGRSRGGRGLLLVLDPVADRVRLEVGQRLEGVYTDAFVAYLEERQMVPFFRAGRVADGILAATELVVGRAQEAAARAGFDDLGRRDSAGGGAERPAALGRGPDERFREGPEVAAGRSPEATVAAYLSAMRERNGSAALDLYTAETRAVLAGWVVTPAQMDAIVRTYQHCRAEPTRLSSDGRRAVVRYPPAARACAPWLLVREDDRWRLDLATAQRILRFGAGNAWHFDRVREHPYAYAFRDWRVDARGFPQAP